MGKDGVEGKRTVVGEREILQLICLLIEIVWIDDGDRILFINIGIAHVFGRVHLHFVWGGNVVALCRERKY